VQKHPTSLIFGRAHRGPLAVSAAECTRHCARERKPRGHSFPSDSDGGAGPAPRQCN
jgi:hypothetical protein